MLCKFLDVTRTPEKADLIFVFAGREERKRYGLELYERGYAPRIILSVGRFEWRRFAELGLASDGGLVELVPTIEAPKRHFFVEIAGEETTCRFIERGHYGTLSEAHALAARVARAARAARVGDDENDEAITILLVSSPEHSRRCLLAAKSIVSPRHRLIPIGCAPSKDSCVRELVKWIGYRALTWRLAPGNNS